MKKIIPTIKSLRKQRFLTQKCLAEQLHMTRSTYSKIESGRTNLSMDFLVNLSKVLNISLLEILKGIGDPVFKELPLMLHQTYYSLSEVLYKAIPYSELTSEHLKLLKRKGYECKEEYSSTPLNGRIYAFGPKDVFRFMIENCGMGILFERQLVSDEYWLKRWKMYNTSSAYSKIEIDEHEYFLVYLITLKMPDNTERLVQIAARDFPSGIVNEEGETDENSALEYLKNQTGALDGTIDCFTLDGYVPHTDVIK